MATPEVPPTEEVVEVLLLHLVMWRLYQDEPHEESQQRFVAKGVHAAAVLYNCYHLKQHPTESFLDYDQFRNLAIECVPSIKRYMAQPKRPNQNDLENQVSIVEDAIMNACEISKTFRDASSNSSKGWPVTKVAVFLIDSKKENCFLQLVEGFWSLIEKDICFEGNGLESESKEVERDACSAALKQVAGTDSKLEVLEDKVVYFPNQAKTATHFYIVQSSESTWKDNMFPIKDVILWLKGPLVRNSRFGWVPASAVDYYYVLPYAEIISEWFSSVEAKRTPTNAISKKDDVKTMENWHFINKLKVERIGGENNSCVISLDEDIKEMLVLDRGLVKRMPHKDAMFIDDARKSKLRKTALRALLNKKQKLSNQRPNMEDELSSCDEKIEKIKQSGIGDCLDLKLDAVLDCYNEICQDTMQIQKHSDLKVATPPNGGFVANVNKKGTDFECSGASGMQQSLAEARKSAATHVTTKLQQMPLNDSTALLKRKRCASC